MSSVNFTHEEFLSMFTYDKITGIFTNKINRNPRAMKGQKAGTVNGKNAVQIRIKGKIYFAHRLAWFYVTGLWPTKNIDHSKIMMEKDLHEGAS
jgi:hypothetical protein